MRKSALATVFLFSMFLLPAAAWAQVKQVYWTTSGMFGPFTITDLIPSVPKEKARDITIPVNMWIIDHPKGLVLFDTGNNVAISDGSARPTGPPGNATVSSPARSATTSSTASCRSSGTRPTR